MRGCSHRLIDVDRCAAAPLDLLGASQNPAPTQPERTAIEATSQTESSSELVDEQVETLADVTLASPVEDAPLNTCPTWTVDGVFADPANDWDGDEITNLVELYNDLDPCVVDELPDFEFTPFQTATPEAIEGVPDTSAEATADGGRNRRRNTHRRGGRSGPISLGSRVSGVLDRRPSTPILWATGDGDRQTNIDEFYNNSDPCVRDENAVPTGGDSEFIAPGWSVPVVLARGCAR